MVEGFVGIFLHGGHSLCSYPQVTIHGNVYINVCINGKLSQISGLCFLITWWPSEGTGGMVEVGRN